MIYPGVFREVGKPTVLIIGIKPLSEQEWTGAELREKGYSIEKNTSDDQAV